METVIEFSKTHSIHMTNSDLNLCMTSAMDFFNKHNDLDVMDFYISKSWQGPGYDMQVTVGTPRVKNEINPDTPF